MHKVALVTGGSSGIGLHTALALRKAGCRVYSLSRRGADVEGIVHITCDVTSESAVNATVKQIIRQVGQIDIVVNCAGFGISGAVELTDAEDAKRQFDVNFFGTVNVCKAVLPHMRQASRGCIVNVSSVAAVLPIPFQTFYSASKAAINAYSQALANEVKPFGISVCAVMPGDIRTGFTAARHKQPDMDALYGGRLERSLKKMEDDEQNGMEPFKVGACIAGLALKRRIKPLYAIGLDYKCFVLLSRILPVRLINAIVYCMYAK